MNRQKVLFYICLLLCGVLIAGAFYLIGYKTAYDRMEAGSSAPVPETFYGEITDISGTPEAGNAVTVRGLAVNDPRYRERGFYDHGLYPVVLDVMFPEKGTPVGFGYVAICKDPQIYIDKLSQTIMENALMTTAVEVPPCTPFLVIR